MSGDWPTPLGGYDHARRSDAPLDGLDLVPVWSLPTLGLPSDSALIEIDGDSALELVYIAGGRAHAHQLDGFPEWSSTAPNLLSVLTPTDLDGDLRPDLIFRRQLSGLSVLRGRDGTLVWESDDDDLSYVAQVLVADLDGDDFPDVLAAERDCGFLSHGVGRTIAWTFAEDPPAELFRLEEETRDYNCGRSLRFADTDGDGELEVVALGNEYAYLYSTVTGDLIEQSTSLGVLPFGVAAMTVIPDTGGDRILLATNNSSATVEEPRRLILLDRNDDDELAPRWSRSVDDPQSDRHHAPPNPVADLDGDGDLEAAHAFFSSDGDEWTSFVVDLETGDVITEVAGRVEALVMDGSTREVITWSSGEGCLIRYTFDGTTLHRVGTMTGNKLMLTREGYAPSGAEILGPLTSSDGDFLYTITSTDAAGGPLENRTYHIFDRANDEYTEHELTTPSRDWLVAQSSERGETAFAHIAQSGALTFLDEHFEVPLPDDMEADLWLPLQSQSPVIGGYTGEETLALARDDRLLHPEASAEAGGSSSITLDHLVIGMIDVGGDGEKEWVAIDGEYLPDRADLFSYSAELSAELWAVSDLVELSDEETTLWGQALLSQDVDGDGTPDVIVQTVDHNANTHSIQAYGGADGQPVWEAPYSVDRAYYDRAIAFEGIDGPMVASSLTYKLRAHDAITGAVVGESSHGGARGLVAADLDGLTGQEIVTSSPHRAEWWAFDETASDLWSQTSLNEGFPDAPHRGQGIVPVQSGERTLLVEGRSALGPFPHNLVVLEGATGDIVHTVYLAAGTISAGGGKPARASLSAGVGFDASDDLPALFVVGGDDGYLYFVDPAQTADHADYPDNLLVHTIRVGSPVAALSAIDTDNDGANELLVPTQNGAFLVFDRPELEWTFTVRDTNCSNDAVDVDTIDWTNRFCAAWDGSRRAVDSVIVTLREQASWVPIAGPITVVDATSVSFESLNLQVGFTYVVELRGFDGAAPATATSDLFFSDGATVAGDSLAPTIEGFVARPDAFYSGEGSTDFEATIRDNSRLAGYEIDVLDGGGAVVFHVERLLNTDVYILDEPWAGLDLEGVPLPPAVYTAELTVYDFAGLFSEATTLVEILGEGTALDGATLDSGLDGVTSDAGVDSSDGTFDLTGANLGIYGGVEDGGCGCRAQPTMWSSGARVFFVGLLLALLARRWRRHWRGRQCVARVEAETRRIAPYERNS